MISYAPDRTAAAAREPNPCRRVPVENRPYPFHTTDSASWKNPHTSVRYSGMRPPLPHFISIPNSSEAVCATSNPQASSDGRTSSGDRESRLLGRDSGRDEQRRAVTRDVLLHIEPERRASPAAAVVATLPAIAAHPFGVAEAGDVCCGGQFRREIPGGVSKRMIHGAKL